MDASSKLPPQAWISQGKVFHSGQTYGTLLTAAVLWPHRKFRRGEETRLWHCWWRQTFNTFTTKYVPSKNVFYTYRNVNNGRYGKAASDATQQCGKWLSKGHLRLQAKYYINRNSDAEARQMMTMMLITTHHAVSIIIIISRWSCEKNRKITAICRKYEYKTFKPRKRWQMAPTGLAWVSV